MNLWEVKVGAISTKVSVRLRRNMCCCIDICLRTRQEETGAASQVISGEIKLLQKFFADRLTH
jgi:hypothetical protein